MIQTLKNFLSVIWYFVSSGHYRQLKKTTIFDPDYYRESNADVAASGVDPLVHYISRGFAELRDPSLYFDSNYYSTQVPEVKEKTLDPLFHFIVKGWENGYKPNLLFDPLFYVQQYPDFEFSRLNPLEHCIQQAIQLSPSPYFDPSFYKHLYKDVAASRENSLKHFLSIGLQERRSPSLYFDIPWYLDKTPVLMEAKIDPISHYSRFGMQEYKSPSPLFDPQYYARTYRVEGVDDLFSHYMQYGSPQDNRPCSWFDPVFYRQHYQDGSSVEMSPLAHYLSKGIQDGLYPNRDVFELQDKPVISLLVPVYNVSPAHLNNCIRSVLYQSYPHWELCLVDDCSTSKEVRPLLEHWALHDSRIKVILLEKNLGISGATNAAAKLATGRYLGFLDNDDELVNDCLFTVVQRINSEGAELYYSDEDLIGEDGRQFNVFNKPDFNKELLLSHNYVTHFVVTEKKLFEQVGGFDRELDGAQDFDMFLKLSERAETIVHIKEILYHWRASESSTSINHEEKQYANEAGRKAVSNALHRRGVSGSVSLTDWKFFYRVQKNMAESPSVAIIIIYNEGVEFQKWFKELFSHTDYSVTEWIVVVQNDEHLLLLKHLSQDSCPEIRFLLSSSTGESQASLYNEAVRESKCRFCVFLDANIQVQTSNWIEEMLGYAMERKTGIVGGRILPFQKQEYIETLPDLGQSGDFYYARFVQQCSRHMNGLQCVQNVLALSWDMAMVNREKFLSIGGFSDEFPGGLFSDSDLCLQLHGRGNENVYIPFALGQWLVPEQELENLQDSSPSKVRGQFQKKWYDLLHSGDPFYNMGTLDKNGLSRNEFLTWYAGVKPG